MAHMDFEKSGREMFNLIKRLYPITRSITGDGVCETPSILSKTIPLEIKEIESGRQVFDWQIPLEWNIQDAWIKNSRGEK
jgi:aminopeptidase-like protein